MQKFLRDVRRVLRCCEVKDWVSPILIEYVNTEIIAVVREFESNGKRPRFLMDRMKCLIAVTLRASEAGKKGVLVRNLFMFHRLLWKCISLQKGRVRGKKRTTTCSVCLQESGGNWWTSSLCGHGFHERCIAQCFDHDTRCPLCRRYH